MKILMAYLQFGSSNRLLAKFIDKRAFCKTKIFVQNQGMREILPQAYDLYSEDKILSITQSLGEKIVLQMAQTGRRLTLAE